MSNSALSIILPVYNAEGRLRTRIVQWTEILAELTPRFEIVIIDDGSIDDTLSVARELSCCFPQVQFAHHSMRHGKMVAVQTGLQRTNGEIVMICEDLDRLSPQQVRQLWELRNDPQLVMVHPASSCERQLLQFDSSSTTVQKSATSQTNVTSMGGMGGIRMLRRTALLRLENSNNRPLPMQVERLIRADPSTAAKTGQHLPHLLVRFKEHLDFKLESP